MIMQNPQIRDRGNLDAERLVLGPAVATDVGEYAVFRAAAAGGSVTTDITNVFWFPDHPVKAGDTIVLYTKPGNRKERVNKDGSTSHFFYWGIASPIWTGPEYVAVIAHIDEWLSTLAANAETADSSAK